MEGMKDVADGGGTPEQENLSGALPGYEATGTKAGISVSIAGSKWLEVAQLSFLFQNGDEQRSRPARELHIFVF
jgi:hypothetical protein